MIKEVKRYDATRYEALRDAAKKATPGPWRMEDDEDSAAGAMYIRQDTPDWREPIARLYGWHDQNYLEVADPTTILELLAERDALLAERDARLLQIDTLTEWYSNSLEVIREITAALPGAYYMDPPDGGDVSVPEQVRRMAKDAERYRWICSASYGAPSHPFIAINDFDSDKASIDAAIDAALQGEQR